MTPRSAAASALSCRHGADPGRDERRERPPPAEPSPSSPARRKSPLPRTMRRSRRKSRRWFAAEEGTLPSSLEPRRCSFSSPDVAAEEASPPSSSSGRRRNRRASSSRAGDPSRSSPPRSLHPRGRDGRTRLPKAVLGGSSPLASFRSFRGGARRPNAPAAPKTFLTLRGTPSRDGDGSEGAWIAAVAASRRALRSFRRRFACAVEGKRRGEGEGSGVGGEGGRRGERVRARTGGGGGRVVVGCDSGTRAETRPWGATRERAGSAARGTHRLLLGESARLGLFLELSPAPLRLRHLLAARALARVHHHPAPGTRRRRRAFRAGCRAEIKCRHRRAREVQDQRRRPCRCGGRVLLRPPPASLVTGRSLRVHAAARCAPAPANRARPRPPAARVNR